MTSHRQLLKLLILLSRQSLPLSMKTTVSPPAGRPKPPRLTPPASRLKEVRDEIEISILSILTKCYKLFLLYTFE